MICIFYIFTHTCDRIYLNKDQRQSSVVQIKVQVSKRQLKVPVSAFWHADLLPLIQFLSVLLRFDVESRSRVLNNLAGVLKLVFPFCFKFLKVLTYPVENVRSSNMLFFSILVWWVLKNHGSKFCILKLLINVTL